MMSVFTSAARSQSRAHVNYAKHCDGDEETVIDLAEFIAGGYGES